jgi:hypothetical protein
MIIIIILLKSFRTKRRMIVSLSVTLSDEDIFNDLIWSDLIWFDRSTSLYNIYDQAAVSLSYELIDIHEKFFVCMRNFKKLHLTIWMMNLMKIKLESRELDKNQKMMNENLIKINHTIITWMSISQAFVDMQRNFSFVWQISKTIIWKSESWTWSKWWIERTWTWWKSDDLNQIIEKASTIENLWKDSTHIRAKFII